MRVDCAKVGWKGDDAVDLERLDLSPICSTYLWMMKRGLLSRDGRCDGAGNGVATLRCEAEIKSHWWLRDCIFKDRDKFTGNIVFCYELYQKYEEFCAISGRRKRTKEVVIARIAKVESVLNQR